MTDFILEEMNKYNADGVDFVSIMFDPIKCPNIYETYTREEWLASNRTYPRTNRRYWKIIDGKKTYIDWKRDKMKVTAKDVKNFLKDIPDDADVYFSNGFLTFTFDRNTRVLNRYGAEWDNGVGYINGKCCGECTHFQCDVCNAFALGQ